MINKNSIMALIRAQIPQANDDVVESIAADIIQDAEAIIHSMVRQATSQEKESQYWGNYKGK